MRVREAACGDEDMERLIGLDGATRETPWSWTQWRDELTHPCARVWLAEEAGQAVGFAVLRCHVPVAELLQVAVLPGMRRRGVAGLLLRTAFGALAPEVEEVWLEVRATNGGAIGLYRSLGFRASGVRRAYYEHPREDALLMNWARGAAVEGGVRGAVAPREAR